MRERYREKDTKRKERERERRKRERRVCILHTVYGIAYTRNDIIGNPNVTKLRDLQKEHPNAIEVVSYDPYNEENMVDAVQCITDKTGALPW